MYYRNHHATTLSIAAESNHAWVRLICLYYFNLKPPELNAVNSTTEALRSKLDGNKRIRISQRTSAATTTVTHVVIDSTIIIPIMTQYMIVMMMLKMMMIALMVTIPNFLCIAESVGCFQRM